MNVNMLIVTTATNRFMRFVALPTERLPFYNQSTTGRTDLKRLVPVLNIKLLHLGTYADIHKKLCVLYVLNVFYPPLSDKLCQIKLYGF